MPYLIANKERVCVKKLVCLAILGLFFSCGKNLESNHQVSILAGNNTFGDVDKVPVSLSGPYRWIGRLSLAKGGYCTASLVGRDLILTNSHCLARDGELVKGNYQFYLGYNNGSYLAVSGTTHANWGSLTPKNNRRADWAIMRLKTPLGDQYGWFGTRVLPSDREDNAYFDLTLAGYGQAFSGSGQRLTAHEGCNIRKRVNGGATLYHDCDISPGDSGAPLFKCTRTEGCKIYALQSAEHRDGGAATLSLDEYSHKNSNVAVGVGEFISKLIELINS